MSMINATVGAAVLMMWGLVVYRVVRRMLKDKRARQEVELEREFVGAVARESQAGANPEDAVLAAGLFIEDADIALRAQQLVARYRLQIGGGELGYFRQLWGIATERGIPLSVLAEAYAMDIDAALERREKYESAMAGARLTVTVLLALPIGAVVLGQTMGLDTPRFFIHNPLGAVLLLVGSLLGCAGVQWTEFLTQSQWKFVGGGSRAGPDSHAGLTSLDIARGLDIFTAALQVGMPTNRAWMVMTQQWDPVTLAEPDRVVFTVGHLLDMGAATQAWESLKTHSGFGPVARQALQQTRSGTALTVGAGAQAQRLRQHANNEVTAAAEKMLVVLAAPLTLCFLPMFVVVGLLPLAIGLAGI
ncbi:type II secretion system F family protein [Corynebacterium auriscanis]|uniref:type II secretion system F family protein n=1 Tax=Corynebacterium auriscanis TaxID=99807 RepID=UPI0025B3815E|nr:hypothetical protein [Corynebacterium auriscanis]WJY73702.1 hypothetical protein CAURIC_10520 [Corynebacterium auriscanis]